MAKLAVYITYQPVSDVEMADGNTLLYHIAWPQNGTVSIIAESTDSRLRSGTINYHPPLALSSHKIIVCQDRYLDVSPKSHERSKRMGADTPPAYELKLWTTYTPATRTNTEEHHQHGRIIDVKASTIMLDPKCSQLLILHIVSGCDANGYFFRKGNLIALRLLRNNDYPLLHSLLGEETNSQSMVQAGMKFFYHLYGEKRHIGTSD